MARRERIRHPGKQAARERMARATPRSGPQGAAAGEPTPRAGDEGGGRSGWSEALGQPLIRVGLYAWALSGIVLVVVGLLFVVSQLRLVVVPLLLALFPAALLTPVTTWLRRRGLPRALAALIALLGSLAALAFVTQFIIVRAIEETPRLIESVRQGWEDLQAFIETAPFGLDPGWVYDNIAAAQEQIVEVDVVRTGVLGAATAVAEIIAMLVLLLVVLFFFLKDGDRIAVWLRDLFPRRVRDDVGAVGLRAWSTIAAYIRGQLLVALVDGVFIGVGLAILGVPLALPLGVLVFFGGLFPIVGAVVTGALAVLVALADGGPIIALIALGLVVAVQQLESNVLAPMVLGKATALHPLAVLTSLTAGALVLGVLGAFIAVPIAASLTRAVGYLRHRPEPAAASP